MNKVVYNSSYGGFSLSKKAINWLVAHKHTQALEVMSHKVDKYGGHDYHVAKIIKRHDPLLVQCIEELGEAASGENSTLEIFDLEGSVYKIKKYDGKEEVIVGYDWNSIAD